MRKSQFGCVLYWLCVGALVMLLLPCWLALGSCVAAVAVLCRIIFQMQLSGMFHVGTKLDSAKASVGVLDHVGSEAADVLKGLKRQGRGTRFTNKNTVLRLRAYCTSTNA